ncbi:hypothetical protein TRVL_06488 [Trypanosoma vivax]|nr:hypothetical protein TRVL_06488 [Trypanosoma vivax]
MAMKRFTAEPRSLDTVFVRAKATASTLANAGVRAIEEFSVLTTIAAKKFPLRALNPVCFAFSGSGLCVSSSSPSKIFDTGRNSLTNVRTRASRKRYRVRPNVAESNELLLSRALTSVSLDFAEQLGGVKKRLLIFWAETGRPVAADH